MISIRDQINAANRLEEIYNAYLEGAYQNNPPFDEVMNLLSVFIKGD